MIRDRRTTALRRLSHLASRRPILVMGFGLLFAALSIGYAGTHLEIETSRAALVGENHQTSRLYQDYRSSFEARDDVIVVVEVSDQLEAAKAFALDLAERLEADHRHVERALTRVDPDFLQEKALLLLEPDSVDRLEESLSEHRDWVLELAEAPGLVTLFESINRQMASALVGTMLSNLLGAAEKDPAPVEMDLLVRLLASLEGALTPNEPYRSPWSRLLDVDPRLAEHEGFFLSEDESLLFVPIELRGGKGIGSADAAITSIRNEVDRLEKAYPGLRAGVTGGKALSVDEMRASRDDTLTATLIALAGAFLTFVVSFRRKSRPFLALLVLTVGLAWTLGLTALVIGRLTILSVAFAAILVGLGIDFSLHLIARVEEEEARGAPVREALWKGAVHAGPGMLAGGVTTALAFFAVMLTDFLGLRELGFIAGSGVLLSLVSALTLLPAAIVLWHRAFQGRAASGPAHPPWRRSLYDGRPHVARRSGPHALFSRIAGRPAEVIGVFAALVVLAAVSLPRLRFDYNLLNLQAPATESVAYERLILERSKRSTWYAVSIAKTLEEARTIEARLLELPSVANVRSLASLIPEDQATRRDRLAELAPLVEPLPTAASAATELPPVDVQALVGALRGMRFKLNDEALERWDPDARPAAEDARTARRHIDEILEALAAGRPPHALATYEQKLFEDFYDELRRLKEGLPPPAPLVEGDLPPEIRSMYQGRDGRYLVQIYPEENIWDRAPLERFVSQLRTVDPNVTGGPVQAYEAGGAMRRGYERGAIYALVVIAFYVLVELRSLLLASLAFTPLLVGGLLAMGGMAIFGVPLNLANLVLLPVLVGIGIDSGIHLALRFRQDRGSGAEVIWTSTGKAVLVSGLTTLIGFGSLMVARHYGIHSIGVVCALGIGSVLLVSFTLLPALLTVAARRSER